MKIVLKTAIAGKDKDDKRFSYSSGQEVDFPDAWAKRLIAVGQAVAAPSVKVKNAPKKASTSVRVNKDS